MITERRPDVSPFSAIEFIANWLSGTLTVRKWAGRRPSILAVPPRRSLQAVVNEGLYSRL